VTDRIALGRGRSTTATILLLLGLALAIRLVVVVGATRFGPADSVGDVTYHAQLVADPIAHLQGRSPDVSQYAPYLGFVEWVTAKPWLVLGASDTTALRLSSVTWDLIGMALLLIATARRFPDKLGFVGLVWAAAPIMWPASAWSAQDETITAAIIALIVLLHLRDRRIAAVAVCVLGLFLSKVLVLPVLAALLLTMPADRRVRAWTSAAVTGAAAVAVTWLLGGSDGLRGQLGYTTDVVGFSISVWATLVLHHVVDPVTAIHLSTVLAALGMAAVTVAWWRRREPGDLEMPRLAAGLLLVSFALLAISNPEYLCLVAPVGIIGAIGLEPIRQSWKLIALGALAWGINGIYYLLRRSYDPTGSLLGQTGFVDGVSRRIHLLDVIHQCTLLLFLVGAVVVAFGYVLGERRVDALDVAGDATAAVEQLADGRANV
jgi:hypothetical protein